MEPEISAVRNRGAVCGIERHGQAQGALDFVERKPGIHVRRGAWGETRWSMEPESTICDSGVLNWALASVILSFSMVSGSLTSTSSAGLGPDCTYSGEMSISPVYRAGSALYAELRAQVRAAGIELGLVIGESDDAIAQIEAANGQIDDGLHAGLAVALGLHLRGGDVGVAIRIDDDVGLRRIHQQVSDVDEALEGREQLEIDLDQLGAEQRRGAGRLQAVNDEAAHLGAQMAPIEVEGGDVDFAAGGVFDRGHDFLAHHVAEPIRLHDQDAGDQTRRSSQAGRGRGHDGGDFPAAGHWKASCLNVILVSARACLSQASIC